MTTQYSPRNTQKQRKRYSFRVVVQEDRNDAAADAVDQTATNASAMNISTTTLYKAYCSQPPPHFLALSLPEQNEFRRRTRRRTRRKTILRHTMIWVSLLLLLAQWVVSGTFPHQVVPFSPSPTTTTSCSHSRKTHYHNERQGMLPAQSFPWIYYRRTMHNIILKASSDDPVDDFREEGGCRPPSTFRKHDDDDGDADNNSNNHSPLPDHHHPVTYLPDVQRVLVLSDLHTDHVDNLAWLTDRTARGDLSSTDLIVVAGDISHDLERMEESFDLLLNTGAAVLFVAGNHEAWLSSAQLKQANVILSAAAAAAVDDDKSSSPASFFSSIDKLERVYQQCRRMGVLIGCTVVGGTESRPFPLAIVPMDSWYDGSLAISECEDLVLDFPKWPWVDFMRCRWPFPSPDSRILRKMPLGLVDFFAECNQREFDRLKEALKSSAFSASRGATFNQGGIMTVSHFLPNQKCLPDWKDVSSDEFLKASWLNHGGGGVSAKFALVAGTQGLERQIRSLPFGAATRGEGGSPLRQIHVFGHSHRPKDFELDNVRYIHNPLGKPREREIFMVNPDVDFQVVWDTTKGEISGETVIRYWEERGGGVEMLRSRMRKSKRKSRYKFNNQKGTNKRQASTVVSSSRSNTTVSSSPSTSNRED